MSSTSHEESFKIETESEEKMEFGISKYINDIPKINIGKNLNLFFDQKMENTSLSPIFPITELDTLLQLYKINKGKEDIIDNIKKLLNKDDSKSFQTYIQNGIKILKENNQLKIIDEHFLKECLILSNANREGAYIIANRISNALFGDSIYYNIKENEENKKCGIAFLKFKDNIYVESDYFENDSDAEFDVNKKIIMKYLPKENSNEIINNFNKSLDKQQNIKNEKNESKKEDPKIASKRTNRSKKLLKKKRKKSKKNISKSPPSLNESNKEKKNKDSFDNNLIEEEKEDHFLKPIGNSKNKLLLNDLNIVDKYLKDFKYTPIKLFKMVRDLEKKRGIDFKIKYCMNENNDNINNEVIIISHKLGIKAQGIGKTKEEAGNKCALNLLSTIYGKRFKTYIELQNYLEHKSKKYLNGISKNENSEKNNNECQEHNELNNRNKRKKIDDKNNSYNFNEDKNKELNESNPIHFNNILPLENKTNNTISGFSEFHDSSCNLNWDINLNSNCNIGLGFGKLFHCNSSNYTNASSSDNKFNLNFNANNKIKEEFGKNQNTKNSENQSFFSKENENIVKKEIVDEK